MPRPAGITLISLLYFFVALLLVVCAAVFMGMMGIAAVGERAHQLGPFSVLARLGALAGVVCLVIALMMGLVGWGLWALKEWARIVALVLSGLGLLGGVAGFLLALLVRSPMLPVLGMVGAAFALVRIAINALILWYLLQPQVKHAFAG